MALATGEDRAKRMCPAPPKTGIKTRTNNPHNTTSNAHLRRDPASGGSSGYGAVREVCADDEAAVSAHADVEECELH